MPLPLPGAYDYLAPAGEACTPGDFVLVPLGRRREIGVVWDEPSGRGSGAETKPLSRARLKTVLARLDAAPLTELHRRFIDWVAAYTLAPPGSVLKMAMSVKGAFDPQRPVTGYDLPDGAPPPADLRLTAARRRVLEAAGSGPPRPARELALEAGVSPGVVRGLAAAGVLRAVELLVEPRFDTPDPGFGRLTLTADQARAARDLLALAAGTDGSGKVILLDGVTGAGKTEVYFEAIAEAIRAGRQVLVLVPEIALTVQWLDRFQSRFGAAPAPWHSELGPARRRAIWRAVGQHEVSVVVGARSALFLPFADLGLIVVDEEHDASFKQEDGVIYHARDMAVVRGHLGRIPVILSTATPSLESVVNVEKGKYEHVALAQRPGTAIMPGIETIDLRREPPASRREFLSPVLARAVAETLRAGEQAMLFLNRRGYAPLTLCRHCGHRFECGQCSAWLVEHRQRGRLQCHHCGFEQPVPRACPECGTEDSLVACGPGVERILEEVRRLFPGARTAVMASDTVHGPHSAAELVRRMQAREIDLLIGTQIMAKGHHFPRLTLVGVVDADLGLEGGDLRATERTFQLLSQVAGRAGRADRPGQVMLQTFQPEHPVMQALVKGDRDGFLAREAESRRRAGMPPFGRLAAIILSGPDHDQVRTVARDLARAAPVSPDDQKSGLRVLGPAPAPFALLRGRHRYRFLLKAPREISLQGKIRHWLDQVPLPRGVRAQVDIDPQSFF